MKLYGFSPGRHLHFLERLECINALRFARINLIYTPLDFFPECRVQPFVVFLLVDRSSQVLVEDNHILDWELSNFLLDSLSNGCHAIPLYCFGLLAVKRTPALFPQQRLGVFPRRLGLAAEHTGQFRDAVFFAK